MIAPPLPLWWEIDFPKLTKYLLDLSHTEGGPKARFLLRYGFLASDERSLVDALFRHPLEGSFLRETTSPHGDLKYVYLGPLQTPDTRNPIVRTVWRIVRRNASFVTLVPRA